MSQRALAQSTCRRCHLAKPVVSWYNVILRDPAWKRRKLSSRSTSAGELSSHEIPSSSDGTGYSIHLARNAQQKQADKEFFIDLLSSAATKRDAKGYLSRLKSLSKSPTKRKSVTPVVGQEQKTPTAQPSVNLGNIFGRTRAVDESPIFTQHEDVARNRQEELETLHVALVKLVSPELLDDRTLLGIGQTLCQLSRLSMSPCVVIDVEITGPYSANNWKKQLMEQADRVVAAIDANTGPGAVRLDNVLASSAQHALPEVQQRKLLQQPLRHRQIPVVAPISYSTSTHFASPVTADQAVLALATELTGSNANVRPSADQYANTSKEGVHSLEKQISLDRLIILDPTGGIPMSDKPGQNHVFVNMQQEYSSIRKELAASRDINNLELLRAILDILPPSSSALVTTPSDAAKSGDPADHSLQVSSVGTRRQRNPLIHNLLTDKPAHSASLPLGRLRPVSGLSVQPATSTSTFVKRGMPLTILPEPGATGWVADNHGQPRLKLTDSRIDLPRLVHLINDSFDRTLDVENYLNRVNDRIAGVIIAGEYEGGALLTWETPPGLDDTDEAASQGRLVPYLDKFAVLKRSQGAGGVADILFNAMVRTGFPNGVCWRSRRDNPVNKWYFERATGTWKIQDTNWTMFWTTSGVTEHDQKFKDYESVCREIQPSWADNKQVVD